jgi:hypothetical protein
VQGCNGLDVYLAVLGNKLMQRSFCQDTSLSRVHICTFCCNVTSVGDRQTAWRVGGVASAGDLLRFLFFLLLEAHLTLVDFTVRLELLFRTET